MCKSRSSVPGETLPKSAKPPANANTSGVSTSAAQRHASDVAATASRPGITRRATIVAIAMSTLPASERPTPRKSAVANACHQGPLLAAVSAPITTRPTPTSAISDPVSSRLGCTARPSSAAARASHSGDVLLSRPFTDAARNRWADSTSSEVPTKFISPSSSQPQGRVLPSARSCAKPLRRPRFETMVSSASASPATAARAQTMCSGSTSTSASFAAGYIEAQPRLEKAAARNAQRSRPMDALQVDGSRPGIGAVQHPGRATYCTGLPGSPCR